MVNVRDDEIFYRKPHRLDVDLYVGNSGGRIELEKYQILFFIISPLGMRRNLSFIEIEYQNPKTT